MLEVSYEALLDAITDTVVAMDKRSHATQRAKIPFLRTLASKTSRHRQILEANTAPGSVKRVLDDFDLLTQTFKDRLQ